ncbi:MAG: acyltransferase [Acidimicrobiales bacterium]|nr:acyltransferase [Acidimicrobiales bacterium]
MSRSDTAAHRLKSHDFHHRPAFDGLRAIAVYAVVLYHADVDILSGGFIGVDLFFVLSGFLVTNVVLRDLSSEDIFSIWQFYARRARRLLPAATIVVVTMSIFTLVSSPVGIRERILGDAQAGLLYFANYHFLWTNDDYFNAGPAASPFLHFWSLAIEEQFYLIFPPLMLLMTGPLLRRFGRKTLLYVPLLLCAATASVQVVLASKNPQAAYFRSDARAYQLFAGVLVAGLFYTSSGRARVLLVRSRAAEIAVILFVLGSLSVFSVSASSRGLAATFIACTLIAGLEASPASALARLLSRAPVVYLGVISYGTYLWHWPVVLVVSRYVETDAWLLAAIGALVGSALASLSYHLVEIPMRRSGKSRRWSLPTVTAGLASGVAISFLLLPWILGRIRRS